jgi:hypothetical protein
MAVEGPMTDVTRREMLRGVVLGAALLVAGRASADAAGKVYGSGVSKRDAVAVKALLEQPDRYVGTTVRVEGTVSAVCQGMGCWLEIADPALGRGVRFKVQDGVIVFPRDAVGKKASAEGVFEEIATSPVREAHQENARAKESAGVPTPATPTEKIYWVRASGAVLY